MRALILCAMLLAEAGLGTLEPLMAQVPYRVVVNERNPIESVHREFLARAFLRKTREWPDGSLIRPVDLRASSPERQAFSAAVLLRSVGAVRRYWQQAIFSGIKVPPPELVSSEDALLYVQRYRGAVAYISTGIEPTGVKVISLDM